MHYVRDYKDKIRIYILYYIYYCKLTRPDFNTELYTELTTLTLWNYRPVCRGDGDWGDRFRFYLQFLTGFVMEILLKILLKELL